MRTQRGRLCLSEFYCDDRPLLTVQTLNFFFALQIVEASQSLLWLFDPSQRLYLKTGT